MSSVVLPADVVEVQTAGHQITGQIFARGPEMARDDWHPLLLVEATVTLATPEDAPGRSLAGVVLLEDADDISIVDSGVWSPYGTWLRAQQTITRMDGSTFVVPYGTFRLDSYQIDQLTGSIQFEANDAFGSQIQGFDLVNLRDQQVNGAKGETWATRLEAMLLQGMGGIAPWWTTLVEWAPGLRTSGKPQANWLSGETSRVESAKKIAAYLKARVICGAGGSAFKIIPGREAPSQIDSVTASRVDHLVKPGEYGNLIWEDMADAIDRRDFSNTMVLTYTKNTPVPGSQVRIEQKRVVAVYNDADEDLRTSGPFGSQTREAISAEVLTDAQAQAQALALMQNTWQSGREVSFSCGPLYGLEQGAMIWLLVPGQTGFGGRLIAASIPLHAEGGAWKLKIRTYRQYDQAWKSSRARISQRQIDETTYDDKVDWVNQPPIKGKKVGLDTDFPSGWHVSGGALKKSNTKDSMTATSSGASDIQFTSDQCWSVSYERRYQVRASLAAVNHGMEARIGINYTPGGALWGPWVKIAAKKSATLAFDNKAKLIPAGATTFGIQIQTRSGSSNYVVRVNSVGVEYGRRSRT